MYKARQLSKVITINIQIDGRDEEKRTANSKVTMKPSMQV